MHFPVGAAVGIETVSSTVGGHGVHQVVKRSGCGLQRGDGWIDPPSVPRKQKNGHQSEKGAADAVGASYLTTASNIHTCVAVAPVSFV